MPSKMLTISQKRKPVKAGSKREEPSLKKQYSRSTYLNGIAGELNDLLRQHAGILKDGHFYQRVLSRLKKETSDDLFVLLSRLEGMGVNERYTLERFGPVPLITAMYERKKLTVRMASKQHPDLKKTGADCYRYELIFLWRSPGRQHFMADHQDTEWVFKNEAAPVFEFDILPDKKPRQWIACVKIVLGKGGIELDRFEGEGMDIVAAGSFDKRDVRVPVKEAVFAGRVKEERVRGRRI